MYWSAGALVALLCGDTVTLSNEDKFPEGINKVYKILKKIQKITIELVVTIQ